MPAPRETLMFPLSNLTSQLSVPRPRPLTMSNRTLPRAFARSGSSEPRLPSVSSNCGVASGTEPTLPHREAGAMDLVRRLGLDARLIRTRDEERHVRRPRRPAVSASRGFLMMAPTQLWPLVTTGLFSLPGKLRHGDGPRVAAPARWRRRKPRRLRPAPARREALERVASRSSAASTPPTRSVSASPPPFDVRSRWSAGIGA